MFGLEIIPNLSDKEMDFLMERIWEEMTVECINIEVSIFLEKCRGKGVTPSLKHFKDC